jgi:hypothetical protein
VDADAILQPLAQACVLAMLVGLVALWWASRRHRKYAAFAQTLSRDSVLMALYPSGGQYQYTRISMTPFTTPYQPFVIAMTSESIFIYDLTGEPHVAHTIARRDMRWFGRLHKYSRMGKNNLWLHVETEGRWQIIKLSLHYEDAVHIARVLKEIAPPALTVAYRRHRPYVHYGPVQARAAEQDIYGAWTLTETVGLYVMPLYLVLMQGELVERTILMETVTRVMAVKRLDGSGGVVTFEAGGESFAYAMDSYEPFAAALAEAAKRSLEAPLEVVTAKKKKQEA